LKIVGTVQSTFSIQSSEMSVKRPVKFSQLETSRFTSLMQLLTI